MTETFYFCNKDGVGRFSQEKTESCPLCLDPMANSGWMQSTPEKSLEGASEPLAG